MYQAETQNFAPATLLVRTANRPDRLAPSVVGTMRAVDPNCPVDHVQH